MDPHLSPARLAAEDHTDAERAHLAHCARCRMDLRRMQEFIVGTLYGERDWWSGRTLALPDDPPREPTEDERLPPSVLPDRYEDLGRIGLGGMGEVRRVRDRVLGRVLAMKLVSTHLADRPALVARFVEEGQVASQLQHPGIVPVHDVGRLPDGRVWFTMKEVRGHTLAALIRDPVGERWTLHRLIEVLAQVSEAVGYAHTRGVVHRDLKPQNVMVGEFDEVQVLDWGLAKIVGDIAGTDEDAVRTGEAPGATRFGTVLGTPAYMPPEQARGEVIGPAADVYALGAMLYEVLTGRVPYVGTTAAHVLQQVIAGPPGPPVGPEALVALCLAAMAREGADRPTGTQVAEAARAWLASAHRRERALGVVEEARHQDRRARELHERVAELRADAARLRGAARRAREDEVQALERDADLADAAVAQKLAGALALDPDLPEAHAGLAERCLSEHVATEGARDERTTASMEARLLTHLAALPTTHPVATRAVAYLRGLVERPMRRRPTVRATGRR